MSELAPAVNEIIRSLREHPEEWRVNNQGLDRGSLWISRVNTVYISMNKLEVGMFESRRIAKAVRACMNAKVLQELRK